MDWMSAQFTVKRCSDKQLLICNCKLVDTYVSWLLICNVSALTPK